MTNDDYVEVVPVETMEEAVEQGAALLDKYRPGWAETVQGAMSDGMFDMTEWQTCMVGTLELFKIEGQNTKFGADDDYVSFNGLSFRAGSEEARWVGFLPVQRPERALYRRDDFDHLDTLWRRQVADRVGGSS